MFFTISFGKVNMEKGIVMGKAENQITTYELLGQVYPPLLSLEQLADLAGLAVRTLRNWISAGQFPLPVVKLGGSVRVKLVDVANWIDRETIDPRHKVGRPSKLEVMRKRSRGDN